MRRKRYASATRSQFSPLRPANRETFIRRLTFDEFASFPPHGEYALTGAREFYGYVDYAGAQSLAATGWRDGLEKMTRTVAEFSLPEKSSVNQIFDVAGCEPDIGRFLSCEPENMVEFNQYAEKKVIKIVVNIALSAIVPQRAIFNRGSAIVNLADSLTLAGYAVEIDIVFCSSSGHCSVTTVKTSNRPLDLDRLTFCVAHASASRRLCWSISESDGYRVRDCIPAPIPPELRGDINVPELTADNFATTAQSLDWIKQQMAGK